MTDRQQEIVNLLWEALRKSTEHPDRADLETGTKTQLGCRVHGIRQGSVTMRKILAYPAYLSSKIVARICPARAAESGWDGEFDLSCMYPTGYIFGAVVWGIILIGAAVAIRLAL